MSQADRLRFEELMREDEQFNNLVEDYKKIWEVSAAIESNRTPIVNVNEHWEQFEQMKEETTKVVKMKPSYWLSRVAAVVVLIATAVLVYQQVNRDVFEAGMVCTTDASQETLYSMVDGSDIFVGSNSELEVEADYNRDRRRTRLHGNAFFVVKPDKDRVFEVVTDHLLTRVKGTTFLIRTNDHSTTVGVRTGVVEVLVGDQTEILTAGQTIRVTAAGGMITRSDLEETQVIDLLQRTTRFENVSLGSILKHLNDYHSLKIQAPKTLLDETYTLDITGLSSEEIIEVLEVLTSTTRERRGDYYFLKS